MTATTDAGGGASSRARRKPRIDYRPSREAMAIIDGKRERYYPLNSGSRVLDAIVMEWAELTGLNKRPIKPPMTPLRAAGVSARIRAHAHDFGSDLPPWADAYLSACRLREASRRVTCGARRHRDGQPCRAKSEPGKRRCKWHGGCSTGPRTVEGKARALANLRRGRSAAASCGDAPANRYGLES